MWLNPDSLRHWMCAMDTKVAYVEVHPVVGGTFRIDMQAEDGRIYVHTGQYLEIRRPHKLMFTWNSTMLGERSSQVTVEFCEQAENCSLVLLHELPPDDVIVESHRQGWTTILDLFVHALRQQASRS